MFATIFSLPCSYAVRAVTYLAAQSGGKLTGKEEIARNESIPPAFLSKLLLCLCRDRLLHSRKGFRGGYELAVPAEQIPLLAIVRSVDGEPFRKCLLEDRKCSSSHPCELHPSWSAVREDLLDYLEKMTVADIVRVRRERRGEAGFEIADGSEGTSHRTQIGE